MAFDFPANPTEGQTFQAPNGPVYVFNSPTWKATDSFNTTPPGAVMMFPSSTPPPGWLKANGALLSRSAYAALFAMIGTTFGAGDGSTTFALPDLRGEFLRAWDDSRGIDAARAFGSAQTDGIKTHDHAISVTSANDSPDHTHVASGTTGLVSANHTHTFSDAASTTGGVSANHTHSVPAGGGAFPAASNAINIPSTPAQTTGANSVGHTHSVAVSGTTGTISANHSHTFSDTTTGASVRHTHGVSGASAANTGAIAETRPRNIALLACIKY